MPNQQIKIISLIVLFVSSLFITGCNNDEVLTPKLILNPIVNRFIKLIQNNQITDAYYLTHPKFQKNSNLSEFHKLCKFYKLNTIAGSQLDKFTIIKSTAKVSGTLNYKNYIDIPVVFSLGKDQDIFKVIHIDLDLKTYFENNGMIPPTIPQMNKIVEKTFKQFHGAARKGSMKEFYQSISSVWRDDIESYELDDLYSNLMISEFVKHNFKDTKIKVNPISGINQSGILICTGDIHSDLSISYEFQYYFEDGAFKPLSVRVKLLK